MQVNEEKNTPGVISGQKDDKGEATQPRTGRSKEGVRSSLGSPCEGAPVVDVGWCEPAVRAYNAAIKRVDASIARAIAEAIHASLE